MTVNKKQNFKIQGDNNMSIKDTVVSAAGKVVSVFTGLSAQIRNENYVSPDI